MAKKGKADNTNVIWIVVVAIVAIVALVLMMKPTQNNATPTGKAYGGNWDCIEFCIGYCTQSSGATIPAGTQECIRSCIRNLCA